MIAQFWWLMAMILALAVECVFVWRVVKRHQHQELPFVLLAMVVVLICGQMVRLV